MDTTIKQLYFSTTLDRITARTGIERTDGLGLAAMKLVCGTLLKVTTVAAAALETLAFGLLLAISYPLRPLLSKKTASNLTTAVLGAATTTMRSIKALAHPRAQTHPKAPISPATHSHDEPAAPPEIDNSTLMPEDPHPEDHQVTDPAGNGEKSAFFAGHRAAALAFGALSAAALIAIYYGRYAPLKNTSHPPASQIGKCWENLRPSPLFSSDKQGVRAFIDYMKSNKCWDFTSDAVYHDAFGNSPLVPSAQRELDHFLVHQIDLIAQNHPLYNHANITQGGKPLGLDICEVRRAMRSYVRQRGTESMKWLLDTFEPRSALCSSYWEKYGSVDKILQGAKKSNAFYDRLAQSGIVDVPATIFDHIYASAAAAF